MLISDLIVPFIISSVCVLLVFLILARIFKSPIKSAILSSFWGIIFFYFGFIKEYILKISGAYFHLKYSLPIVLIIGILVSLKIKKLDAVKSVKLNYFFNLLFIIYILVDIGILTYKHFTNPQINLQLVEETSLPKTLTNDTKEAVKPDVYFLVFDEYSSSVSLKENYGYDNSSLDSFLLSKGFYISRQSKSNYTYTVFSLASTLNFNYFKNAKDLSFPDGFGAVWNQIYENKVFTAFKDEGYEIKNLSFFNINENPAPAESFSRVWTSKFLFDKSLFHLLNLGYLWFDKKYYTHKLEDKMSSIQTAFSNKSEKPKFYYIHFILPHHPYVFNSDGSERSSTEYTKVVADKSKYYLQQLIFTNTVIKEVINKIMQLDKKKIILLEGDHGNRFYTSQNSSIKTKYFSEKNDFKNLNAYYFFDKNYSKLYDSISPVNSFRVVFSQYFNKPYPLLKDSTFF